MWHGREYSYGVARCASAFLGLSPTARLLSGNVFCIHGSSTVIVLEQTFIQIRASHPKAREKFDFFRIFSLAVVLRTLSRLFTKNGIKTVR